MRELSRAVRFHLKRMKRGLKAPTSPSFGSPETVAWFERELNEAKYYVEFGSGGSTYLAAKLGVPFISIESDKKFLDVLVEKIKADGHYDPSRQDYRYANVGPTHRYGRPLVVLPASATRKDQFRRYSDFPLTDPAGRSPLLVLVDGRFRIACALKAFRALRGVAGWTLLVDDYLDRDKYTVLCEYGVLTECVGRMGIFRGLKEFDPKQIEAAIAKYELDLD